MPESHVGEVVELACLAEQLGCSRCWVYDEGLVTRDVYVTLSAIAAKTERILIGPGITNPYVRHPGATAAAIATIDELSGGRAFLGLGAGGGLTLDPMAIRRERPLSSVRATVGAIRSLFAGECVDFDGPTFSLRNAVLVYGRPDIDIIIAGRGPKMTALGAELADGFNLSYIHKSLLPAHVESLRAGAGNRPFCITYSTMVVTTDVQFEEARAQLSFRLVDSPPEAKELIGMSDYETQAIRRALITGGPSNAAQYVRPEWVESFVIVGTPDHCAGELSSIMEVQGIDEFQLPVLEVEGAADFIERSITMFSSN